MLIDSALEASRDQVKVVGQFVENGLVVAIDQDLNEFGVLKRPKTFNPIILRYLRDHPNVNVCPILDFWEDDGTAYVLEGYVPGKTLAEKFSEGGFSESEAVDILCQVCDGLYALHTADPPIIHKDVKFENIMIDRCGCVKIIDFDISRTYRMGAAHDTTPYLTEQFASPEHYGFGQTNIKSDLYAVGQMMSKMGLTYGRFERICRKATHVDPERRYRDAMELKKALIGESGSLIPLPGFRTGVIWKRIVAVVGFLAMLYFSFTMKVTNPANDIEVWVDRGAAFLAMVTEVDLFTKWTPIFRQMPVLYDSRPKVRWLAHAGIAVSVVFIWAIVEAIVLFPFR